LTHKIVIRGDREQTDRQLERFLLGGWEREDLT